MDTRFVVVGSGYAGTLAALRLAGRAGPGSVTLVDPELRLVERVRLHEALVTGRDVSVGLTRLADRAGVALVKGRVTDLAADAAVLEDGQRIPFDRCIVATGSRMARSTPGSVEHAMALEPHTVAAVRARLLASERVVVLGGGLTGIEVAAEIAEAMPSRRVALVTGTLGPSLSPRARAHVERVLRRLGVALVLGARIDSVEAGIVRAGDRAVPFDLAIDTLGFASVVPAFLHDLRDATGRVVADPALRSREHASVILAGDLATPGGDLAGAPMIHGCQSAMPAGAHAADVAWASATGAQVSPFAFLPNGYCVSLGRRDGVVDTTSGIVFTGRTAAWLKERVVRYTVSSMHWQASGWDYRWRPFFRAARALAAPRATLMATTA